eukprot:12826187-Alexandrium_andersonii.AAC.1
MAAKLFCLLGAAPSLLAALRVDRPSVAGEHGWDMTGLRDIVDASVSSAMKTGIQSKSIKAK